VVAMVTAAVIAGAPALAHGVQHALFAHNADKVDGKHAVKSGAGLGKRAKKLVATNAAGYLPNNIIQKAVDSQLIDGLDSTAFAPATHDHDDRYFTEAESDARFVLQTDETVFAFGQIREDASIRNGSSRLVSVDHPAAGQYCLNFSPVPAQVRTEGAVVGLAGGGAAAIFARVTNGQQNFTCPTSGALQISVVDDAGALTNGRFSFILP
jgi:hypothetical protein